MPRRATAKGLHHSGRFWLDWDARADGSLRSPYLAIFWYDTAARRTRSLSTGTADVEAARIQLIKKDLTESGIGAFCPTCGQKVEAQSGYGLCDAIRDYLAIKDDKILAARLDHVLDYVEHIGAQAARCSDIGEDWIAGFRAWSLAQPVVFTSGRVRDEPRAFSTTENSVIALAAAINKAKSRGQIADPAMFRPIQTKELNNTPQVRLTVAEIARAFAYAADPRMKVRRRSLHRYLIAAVSTLARPDAIVDLSTTPARAQWNSDAKVISLNQKGRRQTKKYRPILPAPWQFALHLDACDGFYVPVKDITGAWETMRDSLGWPSDGQYGPKLIRRSMAKLLRDRLPKRDWPEIEMMLGHDKFDQTSDIYAPFDPDYLAAAKAEVERIIGEIESLAPGAFHRSNTGDGAVVIPMKGGNYAAK